MESIRSLMVEWTWLSFAKLFEAAWTMPSDGAAIHPKIAEHKAIAIRLIVPAPSAKGARPS